VNCLAYGCINFGISVVSGQIRTPVMHDLWYSLDHWFVARSAAFSGALASEKLVQLDSRLTHRVCLGFILLYLASSSLFPLSDLDLRRALSNLFMQPSHSVSTQISNTLSSWLVTIPISPTGICIPKIGKISNERSIDCTFWKRKRSRGFRHSYRPSMAFTRGMIYLKHNSSNTDLTGISFSTWKAKVKEWNFSKNLPGPVMHSIVAKEAQRTSLGKRTAFFCENTPITGEKIDNFKKKHCRGFAPSVATGELLDNSF
jgi:hypothetical protein